MIDHISYPVKDFGQSIEFYDATLELLGYKRVVNVDIPEAKYSGYGASNKPDFWIGQLSTDMDIKTLASTPGLHFAFVAPSVEAIHDWYQKCLELGAKDNGEPGPREIYHPGYYGAFVVDINGWKIEACLHHYQP